MASSLDRPILLSSLPAIWRKEVVACVECYHAERRVTVCARHRIAIRASHPEEFQ